VVCIDPFHVAAWASDALDEVRRETWNEARHGGMKAHARDLKGARYALWKNPEDLTSRQQAKLAWVAKVNKRLYRAYLLKEQLRLILHVKNADAIGMLQKWIAWAQRSQIPSFVELARRIGKNMKGILQALLNNLSNGLIESTIIWSDGGGVFDGDEAAVAVGGGRVLWSGVVEVHDVAGCMK